MIDRIRDIQVLRALAIGMVIVHQGNMNLITWQSPALERMRVYFGGAAGVDLFLVISGFVIARSFMAAFAHSSTPGISVAEFWLKRFFRIIPAAWFWLAVILFLSVFFNESGAFGSLRAAVEGAFAAVLQVANIRLAECYGVFECGPVAVYWSLSLEEQFYVVFPVLALVAGRRLPLFLICFVLAQFFIPALMLPGHFRMTGIAIGVLLACYANGQTYKSLEPVVLLHTTWLRRVIVLAMLFCLVSVMAQGLNIVSMAFSYNLAALLSAGLVFLASFNRDYIFGEGLLKRLLVWIGDRSYAFYLTHLPAFFLTRELFHRVLPELTNSSLAFVAYVTCAAVLMLLFSEATYRLIEQPLRRKGLNWLKKRKQEMAISKENHHAQKIA